MRIGTNDLYTMLDIGSQYSNERECWNKMNWYCIQRSHELIRFRGVKGHKRRQLYRHAAWKIIQKKDPRYKKYIIPNDISGKSQCRLTLRYKVYRFIKRIIKYL
jgi:hypothetical protein